ncbi:Brix domain-containing protein C4F8.04 [Grifola frondosa]|uniref:Brix domain-containing protein C4F8.04 n=1 Tax=Grifola frondosa TaxID=5627 RepID=A0A1C7MEZ0_GRIFR|nr:Brix domain-containing protein C4F8.04 [Grifola frondosa]
MPTSRFEPSSIKNKLKREEVSRRQKKAKRQDKLQRRLATAKAEASDPAAKKKRLAQNVPRTLDNTREFDPSILTADPRAVASSSSTVQPDPSFSSGSQTQPPSADALPQDESAADISTDPFASYFSGAADPTVPQKVLVTTSPRATRTTYEFCDELVGVFPGAEFIRRKKGKGFEMGRIAGWAAGRGYTHLVVVNEDMKKPNAITMVYLPDGPTAYFKLTSIELSKKISGHARATSHYPELVLNGRHRYAFRSTEKVALQEIGPRFTLKLRSLKKGLPAVKNLGEPSKGLEFDTFEDVAQDADEDVAMAEKDEDESNDGNKGTERTSDKETPSKVTPPTTDEFLWIWKPELETTRRTFFL